MDSLSARGGDNGGLSVVGNDGCHPIPFVVLVFDKGKGVRASTGCKNRDRWATDGHVMGIGGNFALDPSAKCRSVLSWHRDDRGKLVWMNLDEAPPNRGERGTGGFYLELQLRLGGDGPFPPIR